MSAPPIVCTRQLRLRPTRDDDVDALYAIHGDRQAMRYTWWAPDREALVSRLAAYAARHASDGFSPWTAELRAGGPVVGWGGLCVDPFEPVWGPEVIYMIHPGHWGCGLASEIVGASLAWAFGELRLPRVGAFARPENLGSLRVLAKSGFALMGYVPELERNQYVVTEEAWKTCRD